MFYNPMFTISSLIIKFVVGRVNLPAIFKFLAPIFFNSARSLIRSEGLLPTLRVLFSINREIMRRGAIRNITSNPSLNPIVVSTLTNVLTGHWGELIANSDTINRNFKWYVTGLIITKFNSIIFYLFRVSVGIILSCLGIIFTTDLGVFGFLKTYASYVIDFVQDHTHLKFYTKVSKKVIKSVQKVQDVYVQAPTFKGVEDVSSNSYSLFGWFLLGSLITGAALIGIDYYFHDYITNVPFLGSISDMAHNSGTRISEGISKSYNYFKSFFVSQPPFDPDYRTPEITLPPTPHITPPSSPTGSDRTITPGNYSNP